eukprot:1030036-Rhodomonas_salina.1
MTAARGEAAAALASLQQPLRTPSRHPFRYPDNGGYKANPKVVAFGKMASAALVRGGAAATLVIASVILLTSGQWRWTAEGGLHQKQ